MRPVGVLTSYLLRMPRVGDQLSISTCTIMAQRDNFRLRRLRRLEREDGMNVRREPDRHCGRSLTKYGRK